MSLKWSHLWEEADNMQIQKKTLWLLRIVGCVPMLSNMVWIVLVIFYLCKGTDTIARRLKHIAIAALPPITLYLIWSFFLLPNLPTLPYFIGRYADPILFYCVPLLANQVLLHFMFRKSECDMREG